MVRVVIRALIDVLLTSWTLTQPAHPTRSAFVRASTTSLGSIAFGSLIVTILEVIRLLIRAVRDNAVGDNRMSLGAARSINWT